MVLQAPLASRAPTLEAHTLLLIYVWGSKSILLFKKKHEVVGVGGEWVRRRETPFMDRLLNLVKP